MEEFKKDTNDEFQVYGHEAGDASASMMQSSGRESPPPFPVETQDYFRDVASDLASPGGDSLFLDALTENGEGRHESAIYRPEVSVATETSVRNDTDDSRMKISADVSQLGFNDSSVSIGKGLPAYTSARDGEDSFVGKSLNGQPEHRRSHRVLEQLAAHASPHHVNDTPSFIALNPPVLTHLRRPDLDLSQTTGQSGMDSPLAEYDHDRRRANSRGDNRMRHSRPLAQHCHNLIMWHNAKDSSIIFTFGTVLLLSLSHLSLISIFAYLSMITLMLVTTFVLMRQITMAFQSQTSEHPFRGVLGKDVVINPDYAHQQLDGVLKPMNAVLVKIRNLYLADSLGQTLKLIFFMYLLTYVGSWFNLLTLLTMFWVGAFSIPKLYDMYREQVDSVWEAGLEGLRDVRHQVMRAVNHQINKIRPPNRRPVSGKRENTAGRIRTQGTANGGTYEAEISLEKKSNGGNVETSYYKKESEKVD